MNHYLVATIKPWNLEAYGRWAPRLPGHWALVSGPGHLEAAVQTLRPRYVFFPHWSWIVPASVLEQTECVCFHMTDVPYGRGGTPLQNLITRGVTETRLTALRMVEELDAGPVYRKLPLSLAGRAEDIYREAADLAFGLIEWIVRNEPTPEPQTGEVTAFERRIPGQSRLPLDGEASLDTVYDHIRMLDAPTYPRAFLESDGWRVEFTHAEREAESVRGRFRLYRGEPDDE